MELVDNCPLAAVLAARLREAGTRLTSHWLERIASRVSMDPVRIFPTDDLLDHVPLLLVGIADYLEDPARVVAADAAVIAKARELGDMRHAQGFDLFEILKEYEILGGILLSYLGEIADAVEEPCSRSELLACSQRVFHAVALIQQATATQYLQRMTEKLAEREDRLRAFNRALTHEFRNRLGAAAGAAQLLATIELPEEKRQQLAGVVIRSATEMQSVLENLLELSRVNTDSRQQRHVQLPEAAREAVRQLRELARTCGVAIRLSRDLPEQEVSAAAVELCLTNLVSNAIKYADPAKPERWVQVSGRVEAGAAGESAQVIVEVRDNGIGVPAELRDQLFQRFFRAHDQVTTGVDGTGLGLSIVRETVQELGGRLWADFPEVGAIFAFSLPCRRQADLSGSGERAGTGLAS